MQAGLVLFGLASGYAAFGADSAGAALGMILNGFVLEHFSWHSVFVLNLPLALGALAVGALLVPTSKELYLAAHAATVGGTPPSPGLAAGSTSSARSCPRPASPAWSTA